MKPLTTLLVFVAMLTASANADTPKVLVLPFVQLNPATEQAWIATAVQQSLQTDLSRSRLFSTDLNAGTKSTTTDMPVAIQLARSAGAKYVVLGIYQIVDDDLRVTGSIVEVDRERSVGWLKSTGPVSDLFTLQDVLASQLKRQLQQAAGIVSESSPIPELDLKGPLRAGSRVATFAGIAPSVATDRNAIDGAYRYQYGRPYLFGYWCGYQSYYFMGRLCAPYGQAYYPRGF